MHTFTAIVAACLLSACSAVSLYSVVLEEWDSFKLVHDKKYDSEVEEQFRLKIFAENKNHIAKHNGLHAQGLKSFTLEMNHFGDLLSHEFTGMMNGYLGKRNASEHGVTFIGPDQDVVLPKDVDWRDKGAVTPVKNQGHCGSCWAFSSTGSLEGQHFRKTGKLVSLSEQNLVDCSTKFGNQGCNGGLMDQAFTYVKENGGIDTEDSYPYDGQDEQCNYNPSTVGADDKGFADLPKDDEKAMKKALATVGPVSIAIDASHRSFQFYSSGVYYEPDCDAEMLDHGVLAVGYGVDDKTNEKYWIVKNSWSETWGQDGYIYMARGRDNNCGVASDASYPLV